MKFSAKNQKKQFICTTANNGKSLDCQEIASERFEVSQAQDGAIVKENVGKIEDRILKGNVPDELNPKIPDLLHSEKGIVAGNLAKMLKQTKVVKNSHHDHESSDSSPEGFENFLGFWIRDTTDDWVAFTLIEFFVEHGVPKAKFYNGTQNHLREIQRSDNGAANDLGYTSLMTIPQTSYLVVTDVINLDLIDEKSLRFRNTDVSNGNQSQDQDTSTFRIQDNDNDVAYTQCWTDWDGTSDDKRYGELENLGRFSRLDKRPHIQRRNELTHKWSNPVELIKYIYDVTTYLGETERNEEDETEDYIGNDKYKKLLHALLTSGVDRKNKITTHKHLGKYIGVWRTRNSQNITTLRLEEENYYNFMDTVTISGFTGTYAVLNGTHNVSLLFQGSMGPSYDDEWCPKHSQEYTLHIEFDSSAIPEEYDPEKHGVAKLKQRHGPITPATEYRQLVQAQDELFTAFGSSTHTRSIAYTGPTLNRLDTYAQVKAAINSGNYNYIIQRHYARGQSLGRDLLYFNPFRRQGTLQQPVFDVNDPFNLWTQVTTATPGSKWDYDIDIKNYLEIAYDIWFAVTGPVLIDQPITSQIGATYGSNGSRIHFIVVPIGITPPPLIDTFGTHPYNHYAGRSDHRFVGGIVKRTYTDREDEVVAYIRIADEGGWDATATFEMHELAFGRNDLPEDKHTSNEKGWLAALLKELNKYNPTRYILDIRENGGGVGSYDVAWATFFGGNRPSGEFKTKLDFANDPTRSKEFPDEIQTVNRALKHNAHHTEIVDTDLTAKVFPDSIVRGSKNKPITLIILDNTGSKSAGDLFPHSYIGPDPHSKVHDLGHHVYCKIVGTLDARLYNGLSFGTSPTDNPNPYVVWAGNTVVGELPLLNFIYEAGILDGEDRHGTLVNQQPWTRPFKLVPSWYEKQWQDIGVIPIQYRYPLESKPEIPNFADNRTWRDLALEFAITE